LLIIETLEEQRMKRQGAQKTSKDEVKMEEELMGRWKK
jgi:hypothetical protein